MVGLPLIPPAPLISVLGHIQYVFKKSLHVTRAQILVSRSLTSTYESRVTCSHSLRTRKNPSFVKQVRVTCFTLTHLQSCERTHAYLHIALTRSTQCECSLVTLYAHALAILRACTMRASGNERVPASYSVMHVQGLLRCTISLWQNCDILPFLHHCLLLIRHSSIANCGDRKQFHKSIDTISPLGPP